MIQVSASAESSESTRQSFLQLAPLETVRSADLRKLKDFVLKAGHTCIHEPDGMFKRRFVTPTFGIIPGADDNSDVTERVRTGQYLQMYDWDACLFSQAESYLGLTDLAYDLVLNFLGLKHADGYIPRCVSPRRIWDGADLCKPFLCQALLKEIANGCSKKELTVETVRELDQYLNYFENHRRHSSGLYHWRNVLESGVDDNFALLFPIDASKDDNEAVVHGYPDGHLVAVDLCSYLVAEYRAFSELANMTGLADLAQTYLERSRQIQQQIEDILWNENLGSYCNYDPLSYQYVPIHSWTNLLPVFFGIAQPDRAQRVIERLIINPEHFLRPAGLSTISAMEGLYNQAKRGLYGRANVANWQGPCWVVPNVFAVRGLLKYGYREQAEELALRILTTMNAGIESTGTLYENYNAETGEPLWAPNFMSWNALSLELFDLVS
jgi:glycogen debranching enzyme